MKNPVSFLILILSSLGCTQLFSEVTFTRVTGGGLGEDAGHYQPICWGDYDGDGFVDLFVGYIDYEVPHQPSRLYHNNGDGTFTRIMDGGIADDMEEGTPSAAAWADFENDGDLDLYVSYNNPYESPLPDRLYLNNGDGTFTRAGLYWITPESTTGPTWGDFDNDGLLDLFVNRHTSGTGILYHHQADGFMLAKEIYAGPVGMHCYGATVADINSDGKVDLLIGSKAVVLLNNGDLTFTPEFPVQPTNVHGIGAADYDNDGDPDIAVAAMWPNHCLVFQNQGEAGWVQLEGDPISMEAPISSFNLMWGDYDNDGYIDLLIPIVTHPDLEDDFPFIVGRTNLLFHNEGDGTFTKVTEGPLVNDGGASWAGAWADYDNDGDLDVALADGQTKGGKPQIAPEPVALYRNDGENENNWLTLTLIGTVSNRSAIGAKVFASAEVNGTNLQQMREVVSSSGFSVQNDMRVHFGLGDATVVDELRIEWPSGGVQIYNDISANQFLEMEEENWAGFPVHTGWADTGDFLGWINVGTTSWLYSDSGIGWLYCPESSVDDSGAWAYVIK